jgi:hypothetical protein
MTCSGKEIQMDYQTPVRDLDLSAETKAVLQCNGIETVEHIIQLATDQIHPPGPFGSAVLSELQGFLCHPKLGVP